MKSMGGKGMGISSVSAVCGDGLAVDVNVYGSVWHLAAGDAEIICREAGGGSVRFSGGGIDGLVSSYLSLLERAREAGMEA